MMRSQRIEYEILNLVLQFSESNGYSTILSELRNILREKKELDSIELPEVADALKRLSPQYLRLHKWSDQKGFIEYPARIANDDEFFYNGDFRLQRTHHTRPYFEKLESSLRGLETTALIADSRLNALRRLNSTRFDFRKLVQLCEEINSTYHQENYLATAMLIRAVLDHVPPLFEKSTFSEVANNYSGGGKSFKDAMQHLESAARKIADGHLHTAILKSETLPVAQQVNFAPQLDVLLSEIIRISK